MLAAQARFQHRHAASTTPAKALDRSPGRHTLVAAVQYEVSVVGVLPNGDNSPASNKLTLTTPSAGSPVVAFADPTGPTTANVVLNPPTTGGPVDSYILTLCPTTEGACITRTCPTSHCPVDGLQPGTSYDVTAVAIVGGVSTPPSNARKLSMPPTGAPALTTVEDTGPTTATATATPPPNTTYTSVRCLGCQPAACYAFSQLVPAVFTQVA